MKSPFVFILFISSITVLTNCTKGQNQTSTLNGTWKVSTLVIKGTDKTTDVSGYTITFDDHGMMNVRDSMNTYNCGWHQEDDMMHSGMDDFHFDMSGCPDNSPMQDLDRQWMMDSQTDQTCAFHDMDDDNNLLCLKKL